MCSFLKWSSSSATLLSAAMIGTMAPIVSAPAIAQNTSPSPTPSGDAKYSDVNFFDVAANFWAKPFIQTLYQKKIITGFPDGTFKPEQPVDRAEFAAMIATAFEQNRIRPLAESGFRDVPANYWATSAIQEVYQTGFMQGYGGGQFLPEQPITRAQAITALAQGLRLSTDGTPADILRTYYQDTDWIPAYAINPIAAATQRNIVVNYPNVKVLDPLKPLTRAQAAALLYQALVQQGKLEPLANNVTATNYIVGRNSNVSQTNSTTTSTSDTSGSTTATTSTTTSTSGTGGSNTTTTQTTSTTEPGDIYALSTLNFTTLSSALKTAGLADTLKNKGPYTVFAPTDQAFAALPKDTLNKLLQPENRETLARILRYHVVPGKFTTNELKGGQIKTLTDRPLNVQINRATNQIDVNNANVTQQNIQASNGVIHAVDKVLLPPNIDLNKLGK
ncbi:fasciclin domain-containing protein [Iningainema tapete]|uniref:Fasciclin domain-containing protein n=1 Tax=Iningainema tapete BLCC-T55 TaxID=2748662 RepID=A0A8J7BYE8_9CYAN|nr:fasciclin domain-containing protein [Iningainema tapete]MBD2774003.1 fasciclin domain-containing protein [Iningainema tapete BLCC-T55]